MASNSLARKRPDLARQWHPTLNGTVKPKDIPYSSGKYYHWLCDLGHSWENTPNARSGHNHSHCPYCTNNKVLKGFNDLKTLFPKISKFAYKWNPSSVVPGSPLAFDWKCPKEHKWRQSIREVCLLEGYPCPYCSGRKVLAGFNDLKTTHPNLAKEADGWDPRQYMKGSHNRMPWKCPKGHTWVAQIGERVTKESECRYCKNREVWVGFNDLATTHPELAKQAHNWDPTTLTAGSQKKVEWLCSLKHTWLTAVNKRAVFNTECPYCSNSKVWVGFNDLATTHPHLVADAYQWDPKTVTFGSERKVKWKCLMAGHIWRAQISNRARLDTACPTCVPGGFSPGLPANVYTLYAKKNGKQVIQFGITNAIKRRLYQHGLHGFDVANPIALIQFKKGYTARALELSLLNLMKDYDIPNCSERGIKFDGSTEAFCLEDTDEEFLKEFKELVGL